MKKKLMTIGLSVCLSGMFLVGCGEPATPTTDHTRTPGYKSREFDYKNMHGETLHCLIIDEGYNSSVMSCVLPNSISTPASN